MRAKEFLQKAYRIDQRINSKLEQVASLRELATKATATLTDLPSGGTRQTHIMENIIVKMADLEAEINQNIIELVELKGEIVSVIKKIDDPEHQTLLELRYLCFKTCEQIAVDMNYSVRNIYKLHDQSLADVKQFLSVQ